MPKTVFGSDFQFLPRDEILSFEEITRLVRVFASHGVSKVRLTGGEPLIRKDLVRLVDSLASIAGIDDLAMTTNGSLLGSKAQALRDAGLSRLTVSLDALDDTSFRQMNDIDFPVARVLAGIEAAHVAGFRPLKVNMVVRRGVNDAQIEGMAEHFRESGDILRFIEFMDVGNTNQWRLKEVVPAAEIVQRIGVRWPIEPVQEAAFGAVAERYRYLDGRGEIGVISSVTRPFCSTCVRARLTAKGELFTCLFASKGHDLRSLLRSDVDDATLSEAIASIWSRRSDRYSELRSTAKGATSKVEMSYIGG